MSNKFYCYVDETGQDTQGKIFIVSIILTESDKEKIVKKLERIEDKTKKCKIKWIKTKYQYKLKFTKEVFRGNLSIKICFSVYKEEKNYLLATILSIAKALKQDKYDRYKTVILVDGLSKKKQKFVSSQLHKLKIKTEKVRGIKKEESDALLRLADSIAGFVRKVEERDKNFVQIYKKVINIKIFKV